MATVIIAIRIRERPLKPTKLSTTVRKAGLPEVLSVDVVVAINQRRAYRSLDLTEINDTIVKDLAQSAGLSPSCFNNQPWRFVFVYDPESLERLFSVLSSGNRWATHASMIIAVCSRKELDCVTKGREYYLFDTGMATAFLVLRATEMGYVAHPIAGFDEEKTKELLGVPEDVTVITLVIFGKRSTEINPTLSDSQQKSEGERPKRLPLGEFAFSNAYGLP